jgi:hypothetical protein
MQRPDQEEHMEIVLLWIDDLDDLVYAAAFILIRTRRFCLQLGLAAALILQTAAVSAVIAHHAFLLAGTAAACVAAWSLALLADRWVVKANQRTRAPA